VEAAELVVRITGDIDDIESKLNRTASAATSFGDKMEKTGRDISNTGRQMTTGFTVPLVALGGFALKTAIDFESAFAGVRKTVDATEPEFAALEQGIRNMAKELPASAVEIAKVAESAGQLGIAKDHILEFSRVMIDLGETTNLTSEDAANAMARIANITKMPQDQFDELASTLVALGNAGASTESEIVNMALRIAGAGNQVGLTQHQIMAVASSLSSLGIEAEAGGSAISTVFIKLSKAVADGGDELAAFAKVAGVSSESFASTFKTNATHALDLFAKGLGRVGEEGGNVFKVMEDLGVTEIRQRDALLRLAGAGSLLSDQLEIAGFAWENNNALTDEAGKRYATTAAQLSMFWNRVKDAAMTLGAELVPALMGAITAAEPLGRFLISAVQWFGALPEPVTTLVIALAGIIAIAGPILIAVGAVVTAFSTIAPVVAAVAGVIIGPVGLIVAAIVGIGIAAYALWRNWDTVWGGITGAFGAVVGFISDNFGILLALFAPPVAALWWLWQNWDEVFAFISGAIAAAASWVGDHIFQIIAFFSPLVAALFWLWDNWRNIISFITGAMGDLASSVNDRLSDLVGWFGELPGRILAALGDLAGMMWDLGVDMIRGFIGGIKSMASAAYNAAKSVVSGAVNGVKSFLGISSPSRLFMEIGTDTMAGLAIGVESEEARLTSLLAGMAGTMASGWNTSPAGSSSPGADNVALAKAIAAELAPLMAHLLFQLLQAQEGKGGDPMHVAREIAWRTGG
jgi:TP901 family phage tail tape measure protein